MKNTIVKIWLLTVATALVIPNLKASELYGISNTNSPTNKLYLIDPQSNTLTQKQTISIDKWSGDAVYLATPDKIYLNNSTSVIEIYDRNSTALENLTISPQMKTIVASNSGLFGIAYNTSDKSNSLYTINLNSGLATEVGRFTYDTGYGIPTATIIKSTSKLYTASSSGRLYEIDIFSGTVNEYNMGIVMQTLVSDTSNKLYGIANNAGKPALYSINTSTAVPTLIATYNSLFIPKATMIDTGTRLFTIDENQNLYDINVSDGSILNQPVLAFSFQSLVALVIPVDEPELDTDNDGIPDSIDTDDDNDCLPDIYELLYPSILNPFVNDANEDPDNDGYTNLEEYIAGSNPNNINDYPIVVPISDINLTAVLIAIIFLNLI